MDKPKLGKLADLKKKQNVVGYLVEDPIVTVFVSKKLTMRDIEKEIKDKKSPWTEKDIVPEKIKVRALKKTKTQVIQIGKVRALADRAKYRPVLGGCEISPLGATWVGTGGGIVKKNTIELSWWESLLYLFFKALHLNILIEAFGWEDNDKLFMLTNAHVTQADVRDPVAGIVIVQPGISSEVIGEVVETIRIDPNISNEYDASLIELGVDAEMKQVKGGHIEGVREAEIGEKAIKYGRTTLLSSGTLKAKNVTVAVDYGDDVGVVWFDGLDLYSYMSDAGDSGSVICSATDINAVGLLFAGSSTTTIAIPMPKVVSKLKVSF